MKIYTLTFHHFDYYEFVDLIVSSVNLEDIKIALEEFTNEHLYSSDIQILFNDVVGEHPVDEELICKLHKNETQHFMITTYPITESNDDESLINFSNR